MASNFTAICWMGMRKIRQFLPLCVRLLLPAKFVSISLILSNFIDIYQYIIAIGWLFAADYFGN